MAKNYEIFGSDAHEMTCALKNCKGCLPDREKRRFHAEGLMEPIAALERGG